MLLPFSEMANMVSSSAGDGLGLLRHGGDGVIAPGQNREVAQRVDLPGFGIHGLEQRLGSRIRPSTTLVAVSLLCQGNNPRRVDVTVIHVQFVGEFHVEASSRWRCARRRSEVMSLRSNLLVSTA